MDPASALAAIVSALGLALDEMRRRGESDKTNDLREALLDLEEALRGWHHDSRWTNYAAARWAGGLPASRNRVDSFLASAVRDQRAGYRSVQEMFVTRVRQWRRGSKHTTLTLEDVLRVYAPEVLDLAPLLIDRHQRLRQGIGAELVKRWEQGGRVAVDEYIAELEVATEGLDHFRRQLAAFIANEFPVASS